MFHKKKSIAVIVSALLISIGSSPLSQANGPYEPADVNTDFTIVLGADSGVIIDTGSISVLNKIYTFDEPGFNPDISEKVLDPDNYVLSSSGVLLQSRSAETEDDPFLETDISEYADLLTALSDAQVVRDLSAMRFEFTVDDSDAEYVTLDFILASKESVLGDYDLAGIFIDGVNYAVLPNGQLLRVNAAAQITDVCENSDPLGCYGSNYDINDVILGTLSPKLTLNAALDPNLDIHTFVAIMANTVDNAFSSSLLFGNFKTLNVAQVNIATFSLGIQTEEEVEEEVVESPPPPPLPDPNQLSTITGTTVSAADSSGNVRITVAGSFPETVRNIDVNGVRIKSENWVQDSTTVTVTVPAAASGSYAVQLWNGSFPVLQVQTVIATK